MSGTIQDKVFAFIQSRGERGATAAEIASAYLFPTGAQPAIAEKLAQSILSADARLTRRGDGTWAAMVPATPAQIPGFTVIEGVGAMVGRRPYEVDCSAIRLDAGGKPAGARGAAIRPDPWPPGLVLPPALAARVRAAATAQELMPKIAEFARGSTLVGWRLGALHAAIARQLGGEEGVALLSLRRLARKFVDPRIDRAADLAGRLGLPVRDPGTASDRARITAELFATLLGRREEFKLPPAGDWAAEQHSRRQEADFSGCEFDRAFIENLPAVPGVYVMRNAAGSVIYVGKARNLRDRVSSYFRPRIERDEKTARIQEEVSRIEVEPTGSDLGACLLEQERIQALEPTINIQFEVHARPAASKEPHRRIVLMAPAADPAQVELFLLHGDRAMQRVTIPRAGASEARGTIEGFFFAPAAPSSDARAADLLQIAWSWIERNADSVNAFDVDLAGGLEASMTLLEKYLRETPEGGKVFQV